MPEKTYVELRCSCGCPHVMEHRNVAIEMLCTRCALPLYPASARLFRASFETPDNNARNSLADVNCECGVTSYVGGHRAFACPGCGSQLQPCLTRPRVRILIPIVPIRAPSERCDVCDHPLIAGWCDCCAAKRQLAEFRESWEEVRTMLEEATHPTHPTPVVKMLEVLIGRSMPVPGSVTREDVVDELGEDILFCDHLDEALVGSAHSFGVNAPLYDYDRCLQILTRDGMTVEEAGEWMEFNVLWAYVGDNNPVFCRILDGTGFQAQSVTPTLSETSTSIQPPCEGEDE